MLTGIWRIVGRDERDPTSHPPQLGLTEDARVCPQIRATSPPLLPKRIFVAFVCVYALTEGRRGQRLKVSLNGALGPDPAREGPQDAAFAPP